MAINPKFNAVIGADISRFMSELSKVHRKIQETASAVVIDVNANISDFMSNAATVQSTISEMNRNVDVTVNADISSLQSAVAEAQAHITELNNNSTVNINGNSSNFNNAANNVNRQTNTLSRRVTEARIGANIGDFESRMVAVTRALTEAGDTVTPQIELEMTRFTRDITEVQDRMREVARSTADPNVEADIAGFMAQMALVQTTLNGVIQTHDIDIHADTGSAHARLSALRLQIRSLTAKDFIVKIQARWNDFQNTMGNIANFTRSIGEVGANVGRGGLMVIAPAAVPVIASAVGLLGNLGPMIGTIAGSTFALGSAFITAGIGAVAFGAAAIPTIKAIFDETNKLSAAQQAAKDKYEAFQTTWQSIVKDLEKPVLSAFGEAMNFAARAVEMARPLFSGAAEAVNNLMTSMNQSLDSAPMKAFFEYLNTQGGPMLETVMKSIGNLMQGFFSMMTAFGPLAENTAAGFLKMSEGFAAWAAGLGKSEKFQSFVNYVTENMPKIRSIFSDAIQGIINMFAGFGGSSSEMMTSLQEMMERFKNFSSTISENQGFQKFIDYVKTNGPVVVDTIGEIVKFLVNLGIGMAPLGEKILGMVNSVTSWANSMMEAHPWLGKLAAGALVIAGGLTSLVPIILLANSLFSGLGLVIAKFAGKLAIQAVRMAAGWMVAMGPIGWIILAVAGLAIIIYKYWDEIAAWTKKTWGIVSDWIAQKWSEIKTKTTEYLTAMWSDIKMKFQEMKDAATQKMAELATSVVSKILLLKNQALAKWLELKVKTLIAVQEMRQKSIEYFTQLAEKVVGKVLQLKNQALAKWLELKVKTLNAVKETKEKAVELFNQLKDKIKEKMGEAVKAVGKFVGEMPGKITSFVGQMVSAGADLVGGVIEGIKGRISEGLGVIGGLATSLIARFKKDTDTHSPSRAFADIAKWFAPGIARGIDQTSHLATAAVTAMTTNVMSTFEKFARASTFSDIAANAAEGVVEGVRKKIQPISQNLKEKGAALLATFVPELEVATE